MSIRSVAIACWLPVALAAGCTTHYVVPARPLKQQARTGPRPGSPPHWIEDVSFVSGDEGWVLTSRFLLHIGPRWEVDTGEWWFGGLPGLDWRDFDIDAVAFDASGKGWLAGRWEDHGALWRYDSGRITPVPLPDADRPLPAPWRFSEIAIGPDGRGWALVSVRHPKHILLPAPVALRIGPEGLRWVPTPPASTLLELCHTADGTAWAAGRVQLGPTKPSRPLVARWDGERWVEMASPKTPGTGGGVAKDIACGRDGTVLVVTGETTTNRPLIRAPLESIHHTLWRLTPGPGGAAGPAGSEQAPAEAAWVVQEVPGKTDAMDIVDVAVPPEGGLWVALNCWSPKADCDPLLLHFDGANWHEFVPERIPGAYPLYAWRLAFPEPGKGWAVAQATYFDYGYSLTTLHRYEDGRWRRIDWTWSWLAEWWPWFKALVTGLVGGTSDPPPWPSRRDGGARQQDTAG